MNALAPISARVDLSEPEVEGTVLGADSIDLIGEDHRNWGGLLPGAGFPHLTDKPAWRAALKGDACFSFFPVSAHPPAHGGGCVCCSGALV